MPIEVRYQTPTLGIWRYKKNSENPRVKIVKNPRKFRRTDAILAWYYHAINNFFASSQPTALLQLLISGRHLFSSSRLPWSTSQPLPRWFSVLFCQILQFSVFARHQEFFRQSAAPAGELPRLVAARTPSEGAGRRAASLPSLVGTMWINQPESQSITINRYW
jgi:hypothetical protein